MSALCAALFCLCLGSSLPGGGIASAAPAPASFLPHVRFVASSGAPLKALVAGAFGSGTLVYYTRSGGFLKPSLVVQLNRNRNSSEATAIMYQAKHGLSYVPIRFNGRKVSIPTGEYPSIVMLARGGWWFRHGVPNYNLRVTVRGKMYAMWGYPAYADLRPSFTFQIQTHADSHGVPQWDLRRLLSHMPGYGVLRTNYVERKCAAPLRRDASPSPLWPYVAFSGAFTQAPRHLAPPIVVNWQRGRIEDFSEIVSLRSQSCSYGMYSLDPPNTKVTRELSFESPWGLYDFTGKHTGLPNLLIRTEHYQAGSAWYSAIDPVISQLPPPEQPSEVVRYNWTDHPGNNQWDYKVDVFGFHPYSSTQSLANGLFHVIQPGYSTYPHWVVGQHWPITTFVDTNQGGYASTEGIYDWSSRTIGTSYWLGWTPTPDLKQFKTIPNGLRGEYRLTGNDRPLLYASNIDHKLHLLHAGAGLWNIGHGLTLSEHNLTGGAHIDDWQLIHTVHHSSRSHLPTRRRVTQETATLHGYIMSSGPRGVTIRKARYTSEAFRILPPTDRRTWASFAAQTSRYRSLNAAPAVWTWANNYAGPAWHTTSGSLSGIHAISGGFRAILHLSKGARRSGSIPGFVSPHGPGSYVLTYTGKGNRWSLQADSPPKLTVQLSLPPTAVELYPTTMGVQVRNAGTEDWHGTVTLSVVAGIVKHKTVSRIIDTRTVTVGGKGVQRFFVRWSPKPAGRVPVHIHLSGLAPTVQLVRVRLTVRPPVRTMLADSIPSRWQYAESVLLALFVVAGTAVVWRRAYGNV